MRKTRRRAGGLEYLDLAPDQPGTWAPLVIGLHGRGASAEDVAAMAAWLNPETFRFVIPNGPLEVENAPWEAGHAWYVLGRAQATSLTQSSELLVSLIDAIETQYQTPRSQMVIVGFSQGAVMALEVGLRSAEPFAGLVAMSGYLYAPETLGPLLRASQDRQVLLLHGTYDDVITVDASRLARDVLEAAGLEPEYHELPLGHRVSPQSLALVRSFLERVLRPASRQGSRLKIPDST